MAQVTPGKSVQWRMQTLNNVLDSAAHYAQQKRLGELRGSGQARDREPDILRVHNTEESAWAKYDVVELSGVRVDPDDDEFEWAASYLQMDAETPGEDPGGRIAVLLEPIAAGEVGWAVVSGFVQAVVKQNSSGDRYAEAVDGSRRLETTSDAGAPCEILWMGTADESDEAYAVLRVSNRRAPSGVRRCCLAEDHPGCGVVFDLKLGTWNPARRKHRPKVSTGGIRSVVHIPTPAPPAISSRAPPMNTGRFGW